MPENTAAMDDLAVIDSTESLTLRRRGSAEAVVLSGVRVAATLAEAEPSGGALAESDTQWLVQPTDPGGEPAVGDRLIDASGVCWTVLSVVQRPLGAGTRCVARSLAIRHALADRVAIQRARWQDAGGGPEVAAWDTVRSATPARIQPTETIVDHGASPPRSTRRYRVLLADDLPLDHNYRILGPDGVAYRVVRYVQAERIDTLAVAEVETDSAAPE